MKLPTCPVCGSEGKRCVRPSEHEAGDWHVEREDLLAYECGCETCKAWLERRSK